MTMLIAQQLALLVATVVLALGPVCVAYWFVARRKKLARVARRSPLTSALLRTPGHSLRERFDEAQNDATSEFTVLTILPLLPFSFLYLYSWTTKRWLSVPSHVIVLLAIIGFVVYQIRQLLVRSAELDKLRLGVDAEMAVGQELDQLMREGAVVFHDIGADQFNVDHVVVARQGVFAVETKGYSKPSSANGRPTHKVTYDGRTVAFPNWSGDAEIRQAERQAHWLSHWLASATGEPVSVVPVLALPGWFIERTGRGAVHVLSGKELRANLLKLRGSVPLTPEQVQRVAHQLEQRCRDVKASYRPIEDD